MDYTGFVPANVGLYVFDLDGTLVDSLVDLTGAVNWILARYGFPAVEAETVRRATGNGAANLLERCFALAGRESGRATLSGAEMERALGEYREHYDAHCAERTVLYPGMREWLEDITARGCRMAVLTNKPGMVSRSLLRALGVDGFFDIIAGPETFGALKPDPAGILRILELTGYGPEETVMVGDSVVDIQTGLNAGVFTCAITGGLGDEGALRSLPYGVLIERT